MTDHSSSRDLLIMSLPNSGTTWVCRCIAKHHDGDYYDEYFNPVLNDRHEVVLREAFGSELACCYRNIALEREPETRTAIQTTWMKDDYTFTKENYSPFKLHLFAEHFRVVVLLRHTAGVFPPSRVRVWSFYEHCWQALKDAGAAELREVGVRSRAMEAHAFMVRHMRKEAIRLGLPIIYYEDLFNDRMEQMVLDAGFGAEVAHELANSRRPKKLDWNAVY